MSIRDLISIRNRHHPFSEKDMRTRDKMMSDPCYAPHMDNVDATPMSVYSVQGDVVYLHKIFCIHEGYGNSIHAIYKSTVDAVDAERARWKALRNAGQKVIQSDESYATFLGYAPA